MDSPVNDRIKASVALKNKFAAFCSDDEGDAFEIVTKIAPIKNVEDTSKKVPQASTTTSASKNRPKLETVTSKNEATHERAPRDVNRGDGTNRDGNRREGGATRDRREGPTRDGNRREGAIRGHREGGATRGHREGGATRGRREGDTPRDGNRREVRMEDKRQNDGNHRDRPQQNASEIAPAAEGEENVNVDRRPNRGDRGTGRQNRGSAHGGAYGRGRSDRTGVHDAPKKEGHGTGNWGTEQDELQGETEPLDEKNVEKPVHEDKIDSGVEMEKEEEKPVGMTLNEWKEKNKLVEPETFNIRKPNNDKKLNLAPLKKAEDNTKENEEFVVMRREPREKPVDISFTFASTANGSGGNRGKRDGFRARGRGDRGPRGRNSNVQSRDDKRQFNLVTDQFPVLGGH